MGKRYGNLPLSRVCHFYIYTLKKQHVEGFTSGSVVQVCLALELSGLKGNIVNLLDYKSLQNLSRISQTTHHEEEETCMTSSDVIW